MNQILTKIQLCDLQGSVKNSIQSQLSSVRVFLKHPHHSQWLCFLVLNQRGLYLDGRVDSGPRRHVRQNSIGVPYSILKHGKEHHGVHDRLSHYGRILPWLWIDGRSVFAQDTVHKLAIDLACLLYIHAWRRVIFVLYQNIKRKKLAYHLDLSIFW